MPQKHGLENRPPKKPRSFFPERKSAFQIQAALESGKRQKENIDSEYKRLENQLEPLISAAMDKALSKKETAQKDQLLEKRKKLFHRRSRIEASIKILERWKKELNIRGLLLPKPRR